MSPEEIIKLSKRVREARKYLGMSLKETSQLLGIPEAEIIEFERLSKESTMNTTRFNRYVHRSKEDNDDIVDFFDNKDLRYCAYEVELVYEYNKETKQVRLIGADGFFLGDEEITAGELTVIPTE